VALVAVCTSVKTQLVQAGVTTPIVVLRHELPSGSPTDARDMMREAIRRRHGIRNNMALIGMVGQFKSHKAYVRGVRVLAALQSAA